MSHNSRYMEQSETFLLHTYNRFPVVFEKGEGVCLYDADGKEYLDFAAGIAVNAFGYSNTRFKNALKEQIDRVIHTSNLYYNEPSIEAAKKILAFSGMDRIFFTNSGTEAVEGAIKAARKYSFTKYGPGRNRIIAMEHSFHGRSAGALSVTGTKKYREPFEPLMGGVSFAVYNDLDSVKALIDDSVCAVIMETIQGEGGIYPADPEFLKGVRALCDQRDILLILDEIQCGMGRTGAMFAWQQYGVKPDIMTSAKALGCGVPVGAFLMTEAAAEKSLVPGDHGTTYGGNPLACAAVSAVCDVFEEEAILSNVNAVTPVFEAALDDIVNRFAFAKERRGCGLLQGVELDGIPVANVCRKALEKGLLVISAGNNVLRLLPPLVITPQQIEEMHSILTTVFEELSAE